MRASYEIGLEIDPDADELLYVTPAEFRANRAEYEPYLAQFDPGYELGRLALVDGERQAHLRDTLSYLVLGVCLHSVPVLLRGEEYLYRYFDDAAITAQFLPSGEDVLVSGLEVEPLVLPLRPLAQALYTCGTEYVAFAGDLGRVPAEDLAAHVEAARLAAAALGTS